MINPKRKLWRWGPIDGRPIYPDPWYDGLSANKVLFPPGWPSSLISYVSDRFTYLSDYSHLYAHAEKVFTRFILHDVAFRKSYRVWQSIVKKFVSLNSRLQPPYLRSLTNQRLYTVVYNWYNLYSREFWGVGLMPEIANLGGESQLLKSVAGKLGSRQDMMAIIEKLSAPEQLSFYQQEECDLWRLRLIKNKQLFARKLAKHQREYYWLLNSYHDTRVLSLSYFKKRLLGSSPQEARRKLRAVANSIHSARLTKERLVEKLNLGKATLKVAQRLVFCIWWQDNRKSYIFQANHIIDTILRELVRRHKVDFNDLHYYTFSEVLALARLGDKIPTQEIRRRKRYFVVIWEPSKQTSYVAGDKARLILNRYKVEPGSKQMRELKGQAVSSGIARGRVKVILSPKQAGEMKRGDILVTTMTSPDFIVAMRKAAAVVTDVGGITSHAAIVSRELGIPCVVGTGFATQVLKTGDRIEVDANNGRVRKI